VNAAGSAVVVWESDTNSSAGARRIIGRRFGPDGAALGAEFEVDQNKSAAKSRASVAAANAGHYVVTWEMFTSQREGWDIYARRYSASGQPAGNQFLVSQAAGRGQQYSDVAADSQGNFVATWSSYGQDGSGWGVYARRFNANGVSLGNEFRVNGAVGGDQYFPRIAMAPGGEFVIVWHGGGLYARTFDAQGNPMSGDILVGPYGSARAVTMNSSAEFVACFEDADGDGGGIFARAYNLAGMPLGVAFAVNSNPAGAQFEPSAAFDAHDGLVFTWTSRRGDGNADDIFARRFSAAGVAVGDEFRVNTFTANNQSRSSVAGTGDGRILVVWDSFGQDGSSEGIFCQRYLLSAAATAFAHGTSASSNQVGPNNLWPDDGEHETDLLIEAI
jgi:hypothetical protein